MLRLFFMTRLYSKFDRSVSRLQFFLVWNYSDSFIKIKIFAGNFNSKYKINKCLSISSTQTKWQKDYFIRPKHQ